MKRAATLLLAAAGAAAAHGQTPPPTLAALDRLGRTIAEQPCPRPVEVKSSLLANPRNPAAPDEMRSTDCRGLRVAHFVSNAGPAPRVLPMELVLEQPHPGLDARLAPGASETAVRELLGAPTLARGRALGYALSPRDTLVFELFEGRVRAVSWSWDVD